MISVILVMKKYTILLVCCMICSYCSFATKLYIRLNSNTGDFTQVGQDMANTPTPNHPDFAAIAWTNNSVDVIGRHLFKFDLNPISQNALVVQAKLSLFANNNPLNPAHSTLSGSNASYIRRVIGSWNSATTCYNNQPSVTSINEVLVGPTTAAGQNFLQIDVTNLFRDIIQSGQNNGLMLMLQTEQKYRSMNFASGANMDTTLQPLLEIEFFNCSDIGFNDITSSGDATITDLQPGQNFSSSSDFVAFAANIGGVQIIGRSVFNIDVSSIPPGSTIDGSYLYLYSNQSSPSGFPATTLNGDNDCLLMRLSQPISLASVTFSSQPGVVIQNAVLLPHPTSANLDYLGIDITGIVSDIYQNPLSGSGVIMQLINESGNKSLNFCSSNNPDTSRRPFIKFCYHTVSGIYEESSHSVNVLSYPNPTRNSIRFSGDNFIDGYKIYSSTGTLISSSNQRVRISELEIQASNFGLGMYFFEGFSDGLSFWSRFVVH